MTYDSWKLDNPEDEQARRVGRSTCDVCGAAEIVAIRDDDCLCRRCAELREEEDAFNDRVDYEFDRWHDQ